MISHQAIVQWTTACMLMLVQPAGGAEPGREYWVSTTGNDADSGTKEKPLATLERARDAAREARNGDHPKDGVTAWLRGGAYKLDKSFELNSKDSGRAGAPVVYRSVPGEEVRLVGGMQIPVGLFDPVTDLNATRRLEPSARSNVWQADLKALGITDYGKLTRRGGIERSTRIWR
jgi:hypothetical protein